LPLIALVLGYDMKIKFVNQPAALFFGHERKYGIGLSLIEINPGSQHTKAYQAIRMSMKDRVSTYVESHDIDHNNRPIWFQQFTQPVDEGLLVFIQNITDSKLAHVELEKIKKELEESVKTQHSKILKVNTRLEQEIKKRQRIEKELEEEMRRREFFTHALVHELKTPLTPIISSSETLLSQLKKETNLSLSKNILVGAKDLTERIEELLDIAKGEVSMLDLSVSWVNPLELTKTAVNSMVSQFSHSGQTLRLHLSDTKVQIPGDGKRLSQVITNLLKNASEYSPEGGEITVHSNINKNNWIVSVEDDGIGISKKDQKNLFRMYSTIGTNKRRGLGIGLALSKMLVDLHGGDIWYKSKKNGGSVFGFTIPMRKKRA
jgi:signal transduction histidine kinase